MVNFETLHIAFCCIAFLVSFHPSNGMNDEESELNVFKPHVDSFREGKTRFDIDTRTPLAIYSPDIVLEGITAKEKADYFIKFHSGILHVDFKTSSSSLQYVSHRKTGVWTNLILNQVVKKGLPVFYARVVVTFDQENKVRMITSTYRKGVNVNTDKMTSHMSSDDVRNEIEAAYLSGKAKSLKHFDAQFGVFPKTKKNSVLAWKVVFGAINEVEEYSVIIDDGTREILDERDITLDKQGRERDFQTLKLNTSSVKNRLSTPSNAEEDLGKHVKSENVRTRKKESEEGVVYNSFVGRALQDSMLRDLILIIIRALEELLKLVQNPSNMPTMTKSPVSSPDVPTNKPSPAPVPDVTDLPTNKPSLAPIPDVSDPPSNNPSSAPVPDVTDPPSNNPSSAPVPDVTDPPSNNPSRAPVPERSNRPSEDPNSSEVPTTQNFNAIGYVFDPDPISTGKGTYGSGGFKDNNDEDSEDLTAQLVEKGLKDLKFSDGKYHLVGPWAQIVDIDSPYTGLFSQSSKDFRFTRKEQGFEAVNVYYHVDNMMRYINNDLGIDLSPRQYEGGVKFDPHGVFGADNSYYSGATGHIAFGEGGVDDAEDPDVVLHELGHGIHDWLTQGGLSNVNGLSEGFGDYVAMSYSRSKQIYAESDDEYHWVFKWDDHNEFYPGRVTNYDATYPGDLTGRIHTDGQIWSSCNMKIWDSIGREKSDKAHFLGLSSTNSNSNQDDAANAVLEAARSIEEITDDDILSITEIYAGCGYAVSDDICGDGIKGQYEECDRDDIGDASCEASGCASGTPTCTQSCKLDYSSCSAGSSEIRFDLSLKTDGYPGETSWLLINSYGTTVLESEFYESNTLYGVSQCVPSDSCYSFTIFDSEGDGVCCLYGEGSYSLSFNGEAEDTDGSFGFESIHTFCPDGVEEGICGNGELDLGEQCDTTIFGDFTCLSTTGCGGGGSLSCNNCLIDGSSCSASEQQGGFLLELTLDSYPLETSWDIKDSNDNLIFDSGIYTETDTDVSEYYCVDKSECYTFTIYDSADDGICCDYGTGNYTLAFDDVEIPNVNASFGISESHQFGDCGK